MFFGRIYKGTVAPKMTVLGHRLVLRDSVMSVDCRLEVTREPPAAPARRKRLGLKFS